MYSVGYSTVLGLSFCLSVCLLPCFLPLRATRRPISDTNGLSHTGFILKRAFFVKMLRSKDMASFTHLESLRRCFRDPSAVLSTKLGSTLLIPRLH